MVKRKLQEDDTEEKPVDSSKVIKNNNKEVKAPASASASAVDVATLGEEKENDVVIPIKDQTAEIATDKVEKKMTEKQLQKIKTTQKKQNKKNGDKAWKERYSEEDLKNHEKLIADMHKKVQALLGRP